MRALIIFTFVSTMVVSLGALTVSSGFLSPLASPLLPDQNQGISGTVSIGPQLPGGACGARTINPTLASWQYQVVVGSTSGPPVDVPIKWLLVNNCELSGTFQIGLNPGTYYVDLTSCMYESVRSFSCSTLPMSVSVKPNAFTSVNISIYTGVL